MFSVPLAVELADGKLLQIQVVGAFVVVGQGDKSRAAAGVITQGVIFLQRPAICLALPAGCQAHAIGLAAVASLLTPP